MKLELICNRTFSKLLTIDLQMNLHHIELKSISHFENSRYMQSWVVTPHQYGIFGLVSQTLFRGENRRGVAK